MKTADNGRRYTTPAYNGFPGPQRDVSWEWMKERMRTGELVRPHTCMACGQTQGCIDYHAEDYGYPWGPHLWQFQLCYKCHMMVHCARRNPQPVGDYRAIVANGGRFAPTRYRDFMTVLRTHIQTQVQPAYTRHERPEMGDLIGRIVEGEFKPAQVRLMPGL
jgi:hypothetical protein